ncbi:hypothetical protein [Cellulomonas sp.]|uniref:hypothetical protein n=1 Tax=Cellulomonas sp. TaxID=40001 RepID=UPI003BADA245
MEANSSGDGVTLFLTLAEAVVLHERIAFSEFSEDLEVMELPEPVDKKVMSDLQQALAPLIPRLGTDGYQATIDDAYGAIDAGRYGMQR